MLCSTREVGRFAIDEDNDYSATPLPVGHELQNGTLGAMRVIGDETTAETYCEALSHLTETAVRQLMAEC